MILAALITFAIATLLAEYDGPFSVFAWLRKPLSKSRFGNPFECAVCLSVYIAGICAIVTGLSFVEYLATVGIAIFLIKAVE